jgi:hypothetical protein
MVIGYAYSDSQGSEKHSFVMQWGIFGQPEPFSRLADFGTRSAVVGLKRAGLKGSRRDAMAQILPFPHRGGIFDPDATSAMGQAYEKAIATIEPAAESQFVVRELIAKRIIRMARNCELDPDQLCTSALSGISRLGRIGR